MVDIILSLLGYVYEDDVYLMCAQDEGYVRFPIELKERGMTDKDARDIRGELLALVIDDPSLHSLRRRGFLNTINKFWAKPNTPSKNTNKLTEEQRVKWIITQVNERTELGMKMRHAYRDMFGKDIDHMEHSSGGGRGDHYDMVIRHTDGSSVHCEEKGTDTYYVDMTIFTVPWANSVQRYNGPGKKFPSICEPYAELWYNHLVRNSEHSEEYQITSDIPSFEDYVRHDLYSTDPSTPWGKEHKIKYRNMHPDSCLNGKKESPKDYRESINPQFVFTDEMKTQLISEINPTLKDCMNEKDCWLQTSGTIDGSFNFRWWQKIEPEVVIDITMCYNTGSDLKFTCHTDKGDTFPCILRFGKGTGFSNLRFDIR